MKFVELTDLLGFPTYVRLEMIWKVSRANIPTQPQARSSVLLRYGDESDRYVFRELPEEIMRKIELAVATGMDTQGSEHGCPSDVTSTPTSAM